MQNLPTLCLNWLSQAILALEQQPGFAGLEEGLDYWCDHLEAQHGQLSRQRDRPSRLLLEYCERCLEVCEGLYHRLEADEQQFELWQELVGEASRAFCAAEQELELSTSVLIA